MSKRFKPQTPSPTRVNRIVVSTCHSCGSEVDWLDGNRAAGVGVDLDRLVEFFRVKSVDELDTWMCTNCDDGGTLSRVETGLWGSVDLQVRHAIARLGFERIARLRWHRRRFKLTESVDGRK